MLNVDMESVKKEMEKDRMCEMEESNTAYYRVLISVLRKITINIILGKIIPIEWICEVNRERGDGGF